MRSTSRSIIGALLLAPVLAPAPARAQEADGACPDGRIAEVVVDTRPVFDTTGERLDSRFGWVYRAANSVHSTTRADVVRRELLVSEGDCYDADGAADAARQLRATRFIDEAEITEETLSNGDHRLIVVTRDEWSKRVEARTTSRGGLRLAGVEGREDNLLGTGQHVSAYYRDTREERIYGATYATPQLFRTHWDGRLSVARTRDDGYLLSETVGYPFRGEEGRWAFRQHYTHEDRYFSFLARGEDGTVRILFPERRREADIGSIRRFGPRGNQTLLGVSLAGEWAEYPPGVRFEREGIETPEDSVLLASDQLRVDSLSTVRIAFLVGQRSVRFVRREALDAVRGTEDVRLGVETQLGVGRSIPALSTDSDVALELGLSAAAEFAEGVISGGRFRVEGRRDLRSAVFQPGWTNVFAQADGWTYWRASDRHTVVGAVSGTGGWNTTLPFQLTLGEGSGLRGFPGDYLPAAIRVTGSVEARSYLGFPRPELFDLGSVVFVDAGRAWAGEVPYGEDSRIQVSAGFGLRGAFPAGSRRTYRLDVGFPLLHDHDAGTFRITLGVGQAIGRRRVRDDSQIRRSSRGALAASIFSFPAGEGPR